jgi:pimeloyl-ACP methyl ester carboxylesterase
VRSRALAVRLTRKVLWVACALATIADGKSATAPAQAIAPDPGKISQAWWASYFKDSRLVVLPDGRKLNLLCQGSGGPVVVLESGLASGAWAWRILQPMLSTHTQVCSYDRSGYGLSPPTELSRSAGAEADDLAGLLDSAGLPGPYILVGHSLGGYIVRLYASRYPNRVAGIVLVDPASEHLYARYTASVPQMADARRNEETGARTCIASVDALGPSPACTPVAAAGNPPAQWLENWRTADLTRVITGARETLEMEAASSDQLVAERRPLPISLIILTRGTPEERPDFTGEQNRRLLQVWRELQLETLQYFRDAQLRVIDDTSHYIQSQRPQAVVDAVAELSARAGSPLR